MPSIASPEGQQSEVMRNFPTYMFPAIANGVHEGGLALHHLLDGAFERGL